MRLDNDFKFTPDDVRLFAKTHGKAAAASWLLLIPPDRFDGDYEAMMYELAGIGSQNGSQE